jgi:hypothetical protein
VPLGVVDFIEVERDSFREVAQGFVDGGALAGHIDFQTLRYIPVFFPVYRGGQVARRAHGVSVTPESRSVVPPPGTTSHGPGSVVVDLGVAFADYRASAGRATGYVTGAATACLPSGVAGPDASAKGWRNW